MSANMERLMKSMNQEMPKQKRILELNKSHNVVKHILDMADKDAQSEELKDYSSILYDQALLVEGSPLQNPAAFAKKVTGLMEKVLG